MLSLIEFSYLSINSRSRKFELINCEKMVTITDNKESIADFYKNAHIFITGGTGFVGKVIIEKLLRSCPDLAKIYVLVRSKREKSAEERFIELCDNEIFTRTRQDSPETLSKLVPIAGEVSGDGLTMSESDEEMIKDNVTIVFHVAAAVKFNEELKRAADLNTWGTKHIMDLCSQMVNLKSVVHVSTAYSTPQVQVVGERVYNTDVINKDDFMNVTKLIPIDLLDSVADKLTVRIKH